MTYTPHNLPKSLLTPCPDVWGKIVRTTTFRMQREMASENIKFGSPIEEIFAIALQLQIDAEILSTNGQFEFFVDTHGVSASKLIPVLANEDGLEETRVYIFPQGIVGDFRVDFLCLYIREDKQVGKMVIECDGHDFHERTKEQAAKDRARDRSLQADGYAVLRFTGSEIWNSPHECANQALWFLINSMLEGDPPTEPTIVNPSR